MDDKKYAVNDALLEEAGIVCTDLDWAHHPQECDLVASLTYFAMVKVLAHNYEEEHGEEPNADWILSEGASVRERLEPGNGFEMFTHDELHVFGHYLFMVAYLLGKSHGAVEAAASTAVVNALIAEGKMTKADAAGIMDGTLSEDRLIELMDIVSNRADEMFAPASDGDMTDFLGGLFDVYNSTNNPFDDGDDEQDFTGYEPA